MSTNGIDWDEKRCFERGCKTRSNKKYQKKTILLQNNRTIRKNIDELQVQIKLMHELILAICVTET